MKEKSKPRDILLHVCCAPCASASIEQLLCAGYQPMLLYANSNIYPREEFEKRREHVEHLSREFKLPLTVKPWEHDDWLEHISQWKHEREGGKRCAQCFRYSLGKTFAAARELSIERFTTALTISPHKSSPLIFQEGKNFPGFLEIDFKKHSGFRRSIELSRKYNLYRQTYCGCEFSRG